MSARRGASAIASWLGLAALAAACATPDASTEGGRNESDERTVFNDSSLFRELCLEADSGLTIAAGRCTPRHQGNPIQ